MARTIGLITELEVVNSVLSVAGDAPIQSLADTYQPATIIKQMIGNVSRKMQTKGYWFNQEYDVVLTANTLTGKIDLPFNTLKFEPADVSYVARGKTVYDRSNRTNTIAVDVVADLVYHLDFEELPQVAREFIRAACRLQYNNEYFGATEFKRELEADLINAQQELDKADIENEDISMFSAQRVNNIAFKNRRRN